MRDLHFESEVRRCLALAQEFKGRSEAAFLISIAKAFKELDAHPAPEDDRDSSRIPQFA